MDHLPWNYRRLECLLGKILINFLLKIQGDAGSQEFQDFVEAFVNLNIFSEFIFSKIPDFQLFIQIYLAKFKIPH